MFNKIIIALVWIALGIAFIWVTGFWIMKTKTTAPIANISSSLEGFAQCLSSKNVKMYGADWCPHCQNQKKLFGEAFKYIDYTECADPSDPRVQAKACSDADITGYPTWKFADGQKIEGEATFEELSEKSGCSYVK